MFNYISSYWGGQQPNEQDAEGSSRKANFNIEEGPSKGDDKADEMRGYNRNDGQKDKNMSKDGQKMQAQVQGGLLNKLYTRMSGHPNCEVLFDYYDGRKFFTAGDDLKGKIRIKTLVEGQLIKHQGVKVSLLGMILQTPEHVSYKNSQGSVIKLDKNRANITAQNIAKYKQYTFMQIQKQVEYGGEFNDLKELEFNFKNLDEELRDHETYNGVDNFIKYFLKIQMTYTGGSMIAGNNLEVLQELIVKNNYSLMYAKKKREEQKAEMQSKQAAQAKAAAASGGLNAGPAGKNDLAAESKKTAFTEAKETLNAEEENQESEQIALDQTFTSNASLEGVNTSGPKHTPSNSIQSQPLGSFDQNFTGQQKTSIDMSSVPNNVLGSSSKNDDDDEEQGDPLSGAF